MEDRDRPDMLSGRKDWDSTSPPSLEEAACSCFCLSYQSPKDDMFGLFATYASCNVNCAF